MDVLLVERNPELQELFAEALRAVGFSVAAESNWALALKSAHADLPTVVVLDASLEPGAAREFVAELHRDDALRAMPIVGMAYRFGAERGILDAGAKCCFRHLPMPDEVVKAVQWAAAVYGETAA